MGANSGISWTDATFNPWIGCHRVSDGCLHCYAETRDRRYGEGLWGKDAPRRVTSDSNWKQPLRWNRDAAAAGVPTFVFCASLADVFEDRPDLIEPRRRLMAMIEATPHLVWMLLTKRPENIVRLTDDWIIWPENAWVGTTVENGKVATDRIRHLMAVPTAPVRFLSCEPLLGPVDIERAVMDTLTVGQAHHHYPRIRDAVSWVIAGGESGSGFRPMDLDHARSLRDQCDALGIPFWFKQCGGNIHIGGVAGGDVLDGARHHGRPVPVLP